MNRLRRLRDTDAGMSLVELIVSMMLTAVVLAMVGGFFVTVARATSAAKTSRAAVGEASNAENELSRVIRAATPVASAAGSTATPAIAVATGTALTLTSAVDASAGDPAPVSVAFTLDAAGSLVETRTPAVRQGGYWVFSGTPVARTLPGPFDTAAAPLFTYLDAAGAAVQGASGGLSAAQMATVRSIRVTASALDPADRSAAPVTLVNTIAMPNVALLGGGS